MKAEEALFEKSWPVNSIPFLTRLKEILDENKINSLKSLKGIEKDRAKACFMVLMGHLYGVPKLLESWKEYERLAKIKF